MFRFGLRSLFYAILVLAILLTLGLKINDWYHTVPLADEVVFFNVRSSDNSVGKNEPPITEAEIVASIRAQLPNLSANSEIKAIYANIVRTKRLPYDASLNAIPGWVVKDGTSYTVWWINLDVRTGGNSGYGLRIRENNQPAAKPLDEPKLNRKNMSWIPESQQ